MNPYYDVTFWGFFRLMGERFFSFLTGGKISLVSDEIQILVLIMVAASAALVGGFLYLRRMTMLANSLSHTILLGIVAAYVLTNAEFEGALPIGALLGASVATGILTAFLTQFFTRVAKLQEDASTGLVFTSLFALGILLVTILSRNAHIGAEVVMGNVDALHFDDLTLVFWVLLANVILIAVFFKEYTLTTFDPGLARALGFSTLFFDYLLMTQVSATAIGAFRAVGVLMVLSFLTAPVMTARLLTHHLRTLLLLAVGIGSFASIIGVALARHLLTVQGIAVSTAGVVVSVLVIIYGLTVLFKMRRSSIPVSHQIGD